MVCRDESLLNDWHAVADMVVFPQQEFLETVLLGRRLRISLDADGQPIVVDQANDNQLHSKIVYGFIWCCPGQPLREIVAIPEAMEADRITVSGGSFGVNVSGLRLVENFLDMGHFPFIHTGWLGEEPHTEVLPYKVQITDKNEVHATECFFYQPVASPTSNGGEMVEYEYKVMRPYIVSLYKTNPIYPDRMDYIALFIQPVSEERCIAHTYLCYIEEGMTHESLRWFMQLIFGQDKPILENQLPKRLPLDPRAETPIRADKVAIAYRRWLQEQNVTYGAIPAGITQSKRAEV